MCCNDCFETSAFGNVNDSSLFEIWNDEPFRRLRDSLAKGGRTQVAECSKCDVVDAGSRESIIKANLGK